MRNVQDGENGKAITALETKTYKAGNAGHPTGCTARNEELSFEGKGVGVGGSARWQSQGTVKGQEKQLDMPQQQSSNKCGRSLT